MIAVVGNLIHEIAVLYDEKEQQSVNKVYHFLVERDGISRSGSQVGTEHIIPGSCISNHSVAEDFHSTLYSVGKTGTNAVAALDTHIEVSLHDALLIAGSAETRSVEQTEHQAELRVLVFFEHTLNVELNVSEFD